MENEKVRALQKEGMCLISDLMILRGKMAVV